MNLPIIRLEVEGMKYAIHTALSQHAAQMDQSIKDAVDEYCKPENIDQVVRHTAREAIDRAVKEEVRNFFDFGRSGRIAIRDAVMLALNQMYPLTDSNSIKE